MAVQNGKDLLVKIDLTGTGNFETVAGLRATRVSFNAESVDVTSLESAGGWRELLAGAGVKSAAISGSGIFRDEASDERARQIFFDGETPDFQAAPPRLLEWITRLIISIMDSHVVLAASRQLRPSFRSWL